MRRINSLGHLSVLAMCVACSDTASSTMEPSVGHTRLADIGSLATVTNVPAVPLPVPAGSGRSEAISVNDLDQIVGTHALNFDPTTGLGDVRLTMWTGGGTGTDLGNIGSVALLSRPEGINNRSEVVGLTTPGPAGQAFQAFHWSPSTGLRALGLPPGVSDAFANDINQQGQIAGGALVAGMRTIAEWSNAAALATTRPVPFGWLNARASALNDLGDIVGWGGIPAPAGLLAFDSFIASGPVITRIGFPAGFASATAFAINDLGVVTVNANDFGTPRTVGAFVWSAGSFTQVTAPILPGSLVTYASFINNVGDLLITLLDATLSRVPAVLQADGSLVILDLLAGAQFCFGVEMNTLGTVAGSCDFPNASRVAVLWRIPANPVANIVGLSNGVAALAMSGRLSSAQANTLRSILASAASQVPSSSVVTIAGAISELQRAIKFVQRLQRNEGLSPTIAETIIETIEGIVRTLRRSGT